MIRTKRIYEPPAPSDGLRVLVERLWPRGLTKDAARVDLWMRDIAPSPELRKWFAHDPEKWLEFQKRYRAELAHNGDLVDSLLKHAQEGDVSLLFAARDETRNSAVLLLDYLKKHQDG